MDEIFTLIGKLYLDSYNSQKVIELLQQQIKEKDQTIQDLTGLQNKDE